MGSKEDKQKEEQQKKYDDFKKQRPEKDPKGNEPGRGKRH